MYNTVNERIKMLRKTLKLSQIEFANKIDSTQPSIYRWEKGEISPRKSALKKMCRIYGVSEKWLLEGIGDLKIEDKPIENKENSESIVILKDHSLLNYAGEKDKLSEVVYLNKDELLILEKFNFLIILLVDGI